MERTWQLLGQRPVSLSLPLSDRAPQAFFDNHAADDPNSPAHDPQENVGDPQHDICGFINWALRNRPGCLSEALPVCGNGILESGEECDDGNLAGGDGCSDACGIECGYLCDTVMGVSGLSQSRCAPGCGNGVVDRVLGEECDAPGEACCTSECRLAPAAECCGGPCCTDAGVFMLTTDLCGTDGSGWCLMGECIEAASYRGCDYYSDTVASDACRPSVGEWRVAAPAAPPGEPPPGTAPYEDLLLSGTCVPSCVIEGLAGCRILAAQTLAFANGTPCLLQVSETETAAGVCESGKCMVRAASSCGNGVVDDGEECDDSSGCCTDACKLAPGATCSAQPGTNPCCDSSTCTSRDPTVRCGTGESQRGFCVNGHCREESTTNPWGVERPGNEDRACWPGRDVYAIDSERCPQWADQPCVQRCWIPALNKCTQYIFSEPNLHLNYLPDGTHCLPTSDPSIHGTCITGVCQELRRADACSESPPPPPPPSSPPAPRPPSPLSATGSHSGSELQPRSRPPPLTPPGLVPAHSPWGFGVVLVFRSADTAAEYSTARVDTIVRAIATAADVPCDSVEVHIIQDSDKGVDITIRVGAPGQSAEARILTALTGLFSSEASSKSALADAGVDILSMPSLRAQSAARPPPPPPERGWYTLYVYWAVALIGLVIGVSTIASIIACFYHPFHPAKTKHVPGLVSQLSTAPSATLRTRAGAPIPTAVADAGVAGEQGEPSLWAPVEGLAREQGEPSSSAPVEV